ncbi:MAG TPA: hypothetical protein VFQ47_04065 [Nitrososphaera sp.]|jgi:hypothetical protein|nr:hypothetical protein [Nitrososphaera sp.]
MDWINILGFAVGVIGLLLAIIQQIRIGNNKKKDFRRYWDIAKTAHTVMARVEEMDEGLKKVENCPREVLISWGKSHQAASLLVRMALQNIFLQDIKFNDKDIAYWKSTGLLRGYLLESLNQMKLEPPKQWNPYLKNED